MRWFALCLIGLVTACGATPKTRASATVGEVIVVQIDGLNQQLLDGYLQRPSAQTHLLARLARPATAYADLAVDAETSAALLVTDATPASLNANTPPLFDLLPGTSIAAGIKGGKQTKTIDARSDAERVSAILAAPPAQLVALRLTGLADALAKGGSTAGIPALRAVDAELARLRAGRPSALLIIAGTAAGPAPHQPKFDRLPKALADVFKMPVEQISIVGRGIHITDLSLEKVAALEQGDLTDVVFHRTAEGVRIYDADLAALRAVHAEEFATWPALEARLARALAPGDTLAFTGSGVPIKWGGASEEESALPVFVDGPGMGALPERLTIAQIPGLIRAALTGGSNPDWQQLTTRATPPADSDWARCVKSRQCDAVIARTTNPLEAADALVAAKAVAAARWLDPTVAAEGATPAFKPAARYAFGDEPKGFEVVDATLPSAAHAGMIARVTGADVIAWQDSAVIAVPYVHALGGPAYFAGPLMEADGYAAFARGVRALQLGDTETAWRALSAAKGLTPKALAWQRVLLAYAGDRVDADDAPELPTDLKGWPNVISVALQRIDADDDDPVPDLPPLPVDTTARQRALYAALVTRTRRGTPCDLPTMSGEEFKAAADAFEAAGLQDFAADSAMIYALGLADLDQARAGVERALALAARPKAALSRLGVYGRLLLTIKSNTRLAIHVQDRIRIATQRQVFEVQRRIAEARAHGKDGIDALLNLIDGEALTIEPDLVRETIDYAVDGKGAYAAKVVQTLLTTGLFAGVLQPDGIRQLQATRRLMEQALQSAPLGDSADERVAQTMPALIQAVLYGMQGQMTQADGTLQLADAQLPLDQVFAAREAAITAAGPDGEPSIAAWGPYAKALVLAGRAVIALMGDQDRAAETHTIAFVEVARRFTHAELGREGVKGFAEPVNALAKMLVELARYGLLPEKARASKAASSRILKAARDFPLDAPDADPAVRPWLRLAGIGVHDLAWALTESKRADPLSTATRAMDALVESWRPESNLGRAGLFLLLAAQHALPDLGTLLEADDKTAALDRLPKVREAMRSVVKAIRGQYPLDTLKAALQRDEAERIFIEHILTVLNTPKLMTGDGLAAALAKTNSELRAAAGGKAGDVRDVLLLIEASIARSEKRYDAAIRWTKAGAAGPSGKAFAALPGLWTAYLAGLHAQTGDRKAALTALTEAEKQCPALTHRLALARALHLGALKDKHGAKKAFKQARLAARRAGNGGLDGVFTLKVQDDLLILNTTLKISALGALLGKSTGSFEVGAGGTSKAQKTRAIGWQLIPQGSPADAVMEALALEAWTALARGDHGTAGTALSGMVTLMYGVDPRHLDSTPATGLPTMPMKTFFPRSASLMYWTATLARLHGFERLGSTLTDAISKQAAGDWPDAPGGLYEVCEGKDDASLAPIATRLRCQTPAVLHELVGDDVARRMERLVFAQAAKRDISAARAALSEAMPTLLPRATSLTAVQAVRAGDDAEKTVQAAVEAGFACELGLIDRPALRTQLIGELHTCGPAPMRIGLVGAAVEDGNATTILETVADGLLIERNITPHGKFAPAAWPLARKVISAPKERARMAERATRFAKLARALDEPREAAWFDALRIAATPDPAQAKAALIAAWNSGLRAGEPLKFFKLVMANRAAEARKVIGL